MPAMIGLVHLVWAPLGTDPLRRFLDSYRQHDAGAPHELIVAVNGLHAEGVPQEFGADMRAALEGVEHSELELSEPVFDLAAYGEVAAQLSHERLCLLNSYSEVLTDGWLGSLAGALALPGVALAGASGSWESQSEWRRGALRFWPYQLARLRGDRRLYPRFPNPHLRTTGLIAARELLVSAGLAKAGSKLDTYLLESGARSLTRIVTGAGLRAVVVGRDGRVYDSDDWPLSATYRAGGQRNLLIADNRTRDWEHAPPRLKRRLSLDAWGTAGSV